MQTHATGKDVRSRSFLLFSYRSCRWKAKTDIHIEAVWLLIACPKHAVWGIKFTFTRLLEEEKNLRYGYKLTALKGHECCSCPFHVRKKAGLSKFECGMVVGTNNSCTTVSEYFRNCWYFPTQQSLEFTENFLKNRKDPMSSRMSGWKWLVDVKKSEENGQIVLSWGNSEAVCTLKTMTSDHTKWMTFLEFSGLWVKKHWQHSEWTWDKFFWTIRWEIKATTNESPGYCWLTCDFVVEGQY